MKAARIDGGQVVEIVDIPNGFTITDVYHPDAGFIAASDDVQLGQTWAGGLFGPAPPPATPPSDAASLASAKHAALVRIDAAAENARLRFITGGAGQAMTYQAKVAEAQRIATDGAPDPTAYPLLSAEVGITANTLPGVAGAVLEAYSAWLQIGAAIEALRLGAKRDIAQASTVEAVEAAAAVNWPEA